MASVAAAQRSPASCLRGLACHRAPAALAAPQHRRRRAAQRRQLHLQPASSASTPDSATPLPPATGNMANATVIFPNSTWQWQRAPPKPSLDMLPTKQGANAAPWILNLIETIHWLSFPVSPGTFAGFTGEAFRAGIPARRTVHGGSQIETLNPYTSSAPRHQPRAPHPDTRPLPYSSHAARLLRGAFHQRKWAGHSVLPAHNPLWPAAVTAVRGRRPHPSLPAHPGPAVPGAAVAAA